MDFFLVIADIVIIILIGIEVYWGWIDRRRKGKLSRLNCEICGEPMGREKRRTATKDKQFKGHKVCITAYNERI